jgi:hypothetical protein
MYCDNLYNEYRNQLVEIEFKASSEAQSAYGNKIIGFLWHPDPTNSFYYEDVKISENTIQQHQLVRLCFKITPGFKMKYGVTDDVEKQLFDKGFKCEDVLKVVGANEIELEVSGNINSFIVDETEKMQSYSVSGAWSFVHQATKVKFIKGGQKYTVLSGSDFYALCNKIRGCKYENIDSILNKYKVRFDLQNSPIQELDLIKALCNTFLWLEYYFVEEDIAPEANKLQHNQEFLPKMYDEFMIDLDTSMERQKDIYFIKHQFGSSSKGQLEELVKMNLLCHVKVRIRNEVHENYFLPFVKFNYKKEFFKNENLYNLYTTLHRDRDVCLNKYYNSL